MSAIEDLAFLREHTKGTKHVGAVLALEAIDRIEVEYRAIMAMRSVLPEGILENVERYAAHAGRFYAFCEARELAKDAGDSQLVEQIEKAMRRITRPVP